MSKPTRKHSELKKPNTAKYILIAVLLAVAGYFIYDNFFSGDNNEKYTFSTDPQERLKNIKEPQFRKEGELEFLSNDGKNVITKIDIELAENDDERMQGLMYRKSMDEARGMLFIFEAERDESFWMRNTIMSLDIIYVNAHREIVKIYKKTTPFSENSLPSGKPVQYVVEVNAGFTDKYGIKEGDKIKFEKLH